MRKRVLAGALAVTALVGVHATGAAAQPASQLWSVVVHFEYADGLSYDYPLASGVPTSQLPAILQDCGRSHESPQVVRYRCYPIPE